MNANKQVYKNCIAFQIKNCQSIWINKELMLTILDFDLVTSRSHWHGITRSITHYLCPEQRKLPKTKELSRIVHHHKKTLYKVFRNCPTRWPYSGKILAVLPVSLWRTGPSCTRTTLWSGNTWIEYFNILLL